jgi:hypothetical protein
MTRLIRKIGALAYALAAALSLWPALAVAEQNICDLSEPPQQLLERLTTIAKLPEIQRDQGYLAIMDEKNQTTWTFTRSGHPAHPAVACRQVVTKDGTFYLDMRIRCDAAEPACLKLKADFEELNKRMIDSIDQKRKN